jgi:hypothetical protein
MVKLTCYIGLLLLLIQCRPYDAIEHSKQGYCYSNNKQHYEKLKYNGYYAFMHNDTITDPMRVIFYDDGFCIWSFNPKYYEQTKDKWLGFYNRGTHFGCYEVVQDTIKVHFIEGLGGMSWHSGFIWYKIVDSNTIKEVAINGNPIQKKDVLEHPTHPYRKDIPLGKFVEYKSLPDPNKSWLKNKKWFWCDKSEYKQWKENLK